MKEKIAVIVLALFVSAFAAYGQENAPARKSGEADLKEKKITLKMERQPLGNIFRELIYKYNIPIGFEESVLDREHDDYAFETNAWFGPNPKSVKSEENTKSRENINLNENVKPAENIRVSIVVGKLFNVKQHWLTVNVENARFEDVLNAIVTQMKNYKWEIRDGIVNIFPSQGRDKRYEELLKLEIKNFSMAENSAYMVTKYRIFSLPEVGDFLRQNSLYPSGVIDFIAYSEGKIPAGFNFSNVKLRDLFNGIIKLKGGGWILKTNKILKPNGKEIIEIEI